MGTGRIALKARYILPIDSSPLPDGVITLEPQRILAVGENRSDAPPQDLGNVAILPALVNAHTHVEFSDLTSPLGETGIAFEVWLRQVIAHRRERFGQPDALQRRLQAQRTGLSESLQGGVLQLGEIATPPWFDQIYVEQPPLLATMFLELLALGEDKAEPLLADARQHLENAATSPQLRYGLSPHAPYTVHPRLLRGAIQLSAERQIPLAMHLAESLQELELLASHSGPLVELLRELDAWDESAIPRGAKPLDYLRQLAEAHRSLIIHGNFLTREEMEFLAQRADRMAVVYCPRTHSHFGYAGYPLSQMLQLGVKVALGTDSRASSPDLSILNEMRWVRRSHPEIPPEQIVRMGTLEGAEALGLTSGGTISVGKRADLVAVRLPDREGDPYELLLDSDEPIEVVLGSER